MKLSDLTNHVKTQNTKFIIVTGGVCSSIGKGVLVSSIGVLLKKAGYDLSVVKWDPYLNVDPGTMSPLVHGEVFVTADGAETDLDLGHYERMIGVNLTRDSSVSSGQIFEEILQGERDGKFLGKCIQLVPHAVDTAKRRLLQFALDHKVEFVLLEIGGTVGDMEGEVFLEAIRQLRMDLDHHQLLHCHLSYVPTLSWTGEIKTKPTQHSVIALKEAGLAPDCLFLRVDQRIDDGAVEKLSTMCGVQRKFIFQVPTIDPIYRLFVDLQDQAVGDRIQEYFSVTQPKRSDLSEWTNLIGLIDKSSQEIHIALIAKYVGSNDPYISVVDAIRSAGYHCKRRVRLTVIEAEQLEAGAYGSDTDAWKVLKSMDGIVVPGGFDKRGAEGKIMAVRWARENKIPYLGLCLGMQVMVIEFARSLLGLKDANSSEFEPATQSPVIALLEEQHGVTRKGASMRLGSSLCTLVPGTKAHKAYKQNEVWERHRHRYEVNNGYRAAFEQAGVVFSGLFTEKKLVEITELADHPFMLGTQFHPEYQSSPLKVHPLFQAFMEAASHKKP
jgi:CTP synthase